MFVFILWVKNWFLVTALDSFFCVPRGDNGALRWCVPAWSEQAQAAHLSNYRPLLEKEKNVSCLDPQYLDI